MDIKIGKEERVSLNDQEKIKRSSRRNDETSEEKRRSGKYNAVLRSGVETKTRRKERSGEKYGIKWRKLLITNISIRK